MQRHRLLTAFFIFLFLDIGTVSAADAPAAAPKPAVPAAVSAPRPMVPAAVSAPRPALPAAVSAPVTDRHTQLARQLIAISELTEEMNSAIRVVDVRIANLKKKPECARNPACKKAVLDFEQQHLAAKDPNKEIMAEQTANSLKTKFSEKEVEWLINVYNLSTYNKFRKYLAEDSLRSVSKFSAETNQKLDKVVEPYITPSAMPKVKN